MNKILYKELTRYSTSEVYPFHMPGHKRNMKFMGELLPYNLDITEISDFDDLHHPEGILDSMEETASNIFKSDKSYCLINGSTVGNIAAIMSVTKPGDSILIARNSHNSIHTGITLNQLKAIYVYPSIIEEYGICGEIKIEDIRKQLKLYGHKIKAVVIVSPTYEGVISDIQGIADEVHKYGIPLIVDEAHGSHLGMHNYFHKNANEQGADIVVHSIHKTLPALTQTALLHVNGDIVDKNKVKKYLKMLQSSSPSYILMAGISRCFELIEDESFKNHIQSYVEKLEYLRAGLEQLKYLKLVELDRYDRGKIVISTEYSNISSRELFQLLREEFQLELEMDGMTYIIAMTSVADTYAGFDRLLHALLSIDSILSSRFVTTDIEYLNYLKRENEQAYIDIQQKAFHYQMEREEEKKKNDELSLNIAQIFVDEGNERGENGVESEHFYYIYPPGIPIVVPGEIITTRHKVLMEAYKKRGYVIHKN